MTFNTTQAKSILQSTTFWGAVISLLSTHRAAHIHGPFRIGAADDHCLGAS